MKTSQKALQNQRAKTASIPNHEPGPPFPVLRAWPFLVLLFHIACALQCAAATNKVAPFSALPEVDKIEILWLEIDCLSSTTAYEFTFQASTNASMSLVRLHDPPIRYLGMTNLIGLFASFTNRIPMGRLALTKADLRALDLLLDCYRKAPPRQSTGCLYVVVIQRRQGQIVASERFVLDFGVDYSDLLEGAKDLQFFLYRLQRQNGKEKR
jgi:hypothetical protein